LTVSLFPERYHPDEKTSGLEDGLFSPSCAVFGQVQMQLRANLKTVHHGNVFRFFFFFLGGTGRRWGLGRLGGGFLELKGLNLMSILPFLRNSIYIYMCV
jgi:hypothetical protein